MTRRLTDLAVRAIRPRAAYFEVVDGTTGLRLGVFPSGSRSWLMRYRRPDSKRPAKLTIGKYPATPLSAARIRAAEARAAVTAGIDPGESKKRAKASAQEAEASRCADTVELHVKQHLERCSREVSDSHWRQARLALNDAVQAWRGRPVSEITRRDVRELVERIAELRGPVAGNRAFSYVRRFFGALNERDIITASPCFGLKRPAKEAARERVLAVGEIKAVHDALAATGGPVAACALLMLYSGQRRGECGKMCRSEIHDGVWSLPAAKVKNRKPHSVPLSRQMLNLIERQPVLGDYIFSYDADKPASGFSPLKKRIDSIAKLEAPCCWHDLRRTCASGMQRLGVRAEVIERAINHRSGVYRSVAGIYQRDPLIEEISDALARWGDFVERIVKGEEPGKVVNLRSRSGEGLTVRTSSPA
jgi:integrase